MQRLADRPGLALLVVVAAALAVDLVGIRERILIVGDEALYAAAAREMLERGDWIVPSFNYEPRYQKPILIYWLIGAAYQLFGVSEAAARLPSAVFGVALCALVFALGRKLGDRVTGLAAGLVMATNVATVGLSRAVMTDVILCACITAAITGFVFAEAARERGGNGRPATGLAFVALAAGFLTKGPVAVLVPALVWLPWLAWRGALGRFLRRRDVAIGATLFCVLVAPWFIAVHVRTQGAFTRHALGYETLERFFGRAVSSASLPWWGYLATLWPAFLPWCAFLPSAGLALLARARPARGRREPDALVAFATWWAVVVYVFFSLGATRVVTYVFPAFPALALLVGRWWSLALAQPRPRRALSPLPPMLALLALMLVALGLLAFPDAPGAALPEAIIRPALATLAALAAGLAGVCAFACWRPAREVFAALVVLTGVAFGAASLLLMPRVEALEASSEKTFGEWLRAHPDVRALAFDDHAPALYFYAQRRVERFGPRETGRFRAAMQAEAPAAAVVRRKSRAALAGLDLTLLAEDYRHVYVANAAWRARATPQELDVELVPPAAVALAPPRSAGVTHFTDAWRLAPDEAAYGLTERAADSVAFFGGPPMGEIVPREVGALDRRGETIEMLVRPTESLYAPFYVSSAGYGMTGSHFLGLGPGTDLGLRSAILGLPRAAFLGWPFWGSDTGGYYAFRSREVFARWLEFSAFCPILEIGGHGAHAPWAMPNEPHFDRELIEIYRSRVQLHHDLIPYVRAHVRAAVERGLPIARPLVFGWPDDPRARDVWDEYLYGDDLLVAPVWREGVRVREVLLPPGAWEDFWEPSRRFEGPATLTVSAPLGRIPVFVRAGASVPGRP